jgi:hypothetical protein
MSQTPSDSSSASKIDVLRTLFLEYKKGCKEILSKVNPTLISDLVEREEQGHHEPIYMLEMFTKSGLDSEKIRNEIEEKTGFSPEIYDHGTHYVTNQKISLELLKKYLIMEK